MKHFFRLFVMGLLLLMTMSACGPKVIYHVESGVIDYSYYSSKGMFLTESNSVNFDYEPLGSIIINVCPGDLPGTSHWMEAKPVAGVRELVNKATEMGANGVINLKTEPFTIVVEKVSLTGIQVTGMAIKR